MKSFRSSIATNTPGFDQSPSQALEGELFEERRHIYETIVEGAFGLCSIAESKQSSRLIHLAEMIVDGIQEMSTEAR